MQGYRRPLAGSSSLPPKKRARAPAAPSGDDDDDDGEAAEAAATAERASCLANRATTAAALDEQIDAVRGIVARAAELETHAARHTAGGDSALDEAEARSQLEFWNAKLAKLIALRETRDRETCDLNTGARERGIDVVASAV